jgi:CheY-like chemotaxis protein
MSGAEPAPAARAVPGPGKVLVMDDEAGLRKIIGLAVWGMGHQTEVAANGQQAIELYQEAKHSGHPFDAVILDLTIRGGMGGLETVRALLQIDPAVKAIAMSGYVVDPVILDPERHGFKATLTKPFDLRKLQEMLGRVMSQPAEIPVAP